MRNQTIRYLIVPGWQGSADEHWQSHWQRSLPNSARVEQADWLNPKREDWVAELQRSIASDPRPTILIAHSLGCITVAHWAAQAPVESLRRVRPRSWSPQPMWNGPTARQHCRTLHRFPALTALPQPVGGLG